MRAQLYRKKYLLFFFCILASFFVDAADTPAPRASVDRTEVNEGEPIVLRIRVDSVLKGDIDYTALEKDFEIYNSGSTGQTGFLNGKLYSMKEWEITLLPKRSGQLQIPPLTIAGARTQPITIQVNPQQKATTPDNPEPIFLETETDLKSAYVQQQILLTLRIYIGVQTTNEQISEPGFENAKVYLLSSSDSMTSLNGINYRLIERKYTIFPMQPGELTIPETVFSAVEISNARGLFGFSGRGLPIRKMSTQSTVQIKPIPKNFSGSVWLPAKNLTLIGAWSGDQNRLSVGDSITRSITIRADGLTAAQLPELDQPQLNAAKLYADQPKLDNTADATGVHGTRIENTALIPTQAGPLQLPETRVVWWDLNSDSEKVATLPSETLTITAGANTTAPTQTPPAMPAEQPAVTSQTNASVPATMIDSVRSSLWWKISTAVLALLWLATLLLYIQLRRHSRKTAAVSNEIDHRDTNEKAAWQNFSDACRANNPKSARQQLLQWATQFYRDENVRSIEQLEFVASNQQLTRELRLLDNRLFGTLHDSSDWNGEILLQVVGEIRKHKARGNAVTDTALPPLYPVA